MKDREWEKKNDANYNKNGLVVQMKLCFNNTNEQKKKKEK